MKRLKDLEKKKPHSDHGFGRNNIVKILFPKVISMKVLMAFFTELKKNPKVHMEVTLNRQNRAGGITIPISNCDKTQCWQKDRHTDQRNRIE